jgi:hypothetical protein
MIINLFANMLFLYYFDAELILLYIMVSLTYILLFNRMNHKLKQVTARASKASKSLFQGTSSSSSRREAMLRCVRGEEDKRFITFQRSDNEEEEQHGEEERCGEEAENVGEGPNEEQKEAELQRVLRQTRRSHVIAPPLMPSWEEDRILIRPLGDM